jgi:hypothetical protein
MADAKTVQFRNVSGETLWVDLGTGSLTQIEDGALLTVSAEIAKAYYFQTGATGEVPLWADPSTTPSKKTAAAGPIAESE